MEFVVHENGVRFQLHMDACDLSLLLPVLAVNVIVACRELSTDEDAEPTKGSLGLLAKMVNWAPHGYHNALQQQVSILYEYTKVASTRHITLPLELTQRRLVALALRHYQEWKTALCEEGKRKHGENWGTGTGFYKMDWTEYCAEFVSQPLCAKES